MTTKPTVPAILTTLTKSCYWMLISINAGQVERARGLAIQAVRAARCGK